MSRLEGELERRCARLLKRHLEAGDERTLHDAYELGREALAEGVGVLDLALPLWRAARTALQAREDHGGRLAQRAESFVLECLSPFEMAHRGAREANEALRRVDERREEQARRIAQQLHDEAGQLLAAVHLALERARRHVGPGGREPLAEAVNLLGQAGDELRRLAHELRPVVLDDLGLMPALRFLGEGVARRSGVAVGVTGPEERLPPKVETAIYRAAQEALNNVGRHARASRASIEIMRAEREVICRIQDDGCGFSPDRVLAPGRRSGLGLDGLRERMAGLGGTLAISSQPGRGTELLIRIPIEVCHGDACTDRG
jgi:two-component system sensor histidine kinase DegS